MTIHYQDDMVTLHHGDALAVARTLPEASADCIVTSPPYFGLRDYGEAGQYGLESSPGEYVETMRALFSELRRVLADDGTLWLNIGDSYYSGRGASTGTDDKNSARRFGIRSLDKGGADWARPKNLLGIPWRVAFALQDDGWNLRNAIVWHKPNAMPESIHDRLSTRYEPVFMFSKSRNYWFGLDAIREPADPASARPNRCTTKYQDVIKPGTSSMFFNGKDYSAGPGKNPGDVWSIPTQPFGGAHFAVMPAKLAERCVQAGCKPGGTVLDPFSGSGTTGLAAARRGRRYIGIDLSREYLNLSLTTRLAQSGLDLQETPNAT